MIERSEVLKLGRYFSIKLFLMTLLGTGRQECINLSLFDGHIIKTPSPGSFSNSLNEIFEEKYQMSKQTTYTLYTIYKWVLITISHIAM